MKPLFKLMAALCLILAASCLIAVVLGYTQPAPDIFPGASQCQCILGIVPGSTSWLDARARFEKSQNAVISTTSISVQFDPHTLITFAPFIDQSTIGVVTVAFDPGWGPPLGALINTYGPPCAVTAIPAKHSVTLRYKHLITSITTDSKRSDTLISPELRANGLTFHSLEDPCVTTTSGSAWRGFTLGYGK